MATLKIDGVEKVLSGKKVLNNISLEIAEETFTTILGPAGAGKTTLLKIIAGTLHPNKGSIYFGDRNIGIVGPRFRNVAMVSQGYNLYPNLTAYENIASPLRAEKRPDSEVDKRVKRQADILHIGELLDKHPHELSGGQCQRVALGRALIREADIYLLDEPLTGLDYKLQEEMTYELKKILNAEHFKNVVLLYAAPNYEEALSMSSKTIILNEGSVLWHGDTMEAYQSPPTLAVARNFCSPPMNLFEGRLQEESGKYFLTFAGQFKLPVTHIKNELRENAYMLGLQTHTFHFEQNHQNLIPMIFNLSLADVTPAGTILHIEYNGTPMSAYFHAPKDFKRGSITLYVSPEDFFIYSKESGKLLMKYRSA